MKRGKAAARTFFAGLAALLAWSAAQATQPAPPRLGYTDLTGIFAEAYDRANAEQARSLDYYNGVFSAVLPGLYNPARYGENADRYRQVTAEFLASYPQQRDAIAEVSRRFAAMFDPAVVDFERQIGPLPLDTPVFLMVSMGEFDGSTRMFGDREHLLFGADMIARLHKGDARPFVQHELFHIYHNRKLGGCYALYCMLWTEGMATYAALSLNPDATDDELLLTIPEPIRPAVEANRREAVCVTLQQLDSRKLATVGAFFASPRLNERLPQRFGYLIGLWVAQELSKQHSLAEMTDWTSAQVRAKVEQALRSLESCTPA